MEVFSCSKERYKKDICYTTFYYPNGKISSEGKTRFDESPLENHWYYDGKWRYYHPHGKLSSIKYFKKGTLVSEEKVQ